MKYEQLIGFLFDLFSISLMYVVNVIELWNGVIALDMCLWYMSCGVYVYVSELYISHNKSVT